MDININTGKGSDHIHKSILLEHPYRTSLYLPYKNPP